MKIVDVNVSKFVEDGTVWLLCVLTKEDGEQIECHAPWINTGGKWASESNARDACEIAAWFKNFARAIEKRAEQEDGTKTNAAA